MNPGDRTRAVAGALLLWAGCGAHGAVDPRRLPRNQDIFFVEHNLVYSRYLSLSHDGTYRQINQDRTATTEVDQGTWEQGNDDTVRLHSERRGLRFRALLSGPLTVVLDSPGSIAALPGVAAVIRRRLADSQDNVFEADTAGELRAPPALVAVDRGVESFGRSDLAALATQAEDVYRSEQTHTYLLTPVRPAGGPLLLVLQGATYGAGQVGTVCREYHVGHGEAPPFYFAQTDARGFAKEVGRHEVLRLTDRLPEP